MSCELFQIIFNTSTGTPQQMKFSIGIYFQNVNKSVTNKTLQKLTKNSLPLCDVMPSEKIKTSNNGP